MEYAMHDAALADNTVQIQPSSLEFCMRLARAHAVLTRRLDNRLSSVHGLSFGDFMVLYYLHRAEGKRLRRIDLAERMGLTASGVTRTLLPMEKSGLVARQPDPRDARVGYAILTASGQDLLTHALVSAEAVCREAIQLVPADQIATLLMTLGQLAGINLSNA
jgi:DNA-binding MarR family transcriptional regulator